MTTEKALAEIDLETEGPNVIASPMTWKTVHAISLTEFVPKSLRGRPTAILACMRYGAELGIPPMVSVQEIDVIEGRPNPSASLLSALIRRAGHRIKPGEITDRAATAIGERLGENGEVIESWPYTFTWEMAQRAGLTGKHNWKTYPEAMLYWRAVTVVARFLFPEVIVGLKYLPEELGDDTWIEEVEPVGVDAVLEAFPEAEIVSNECAQCGAESETNDADLCPNCVERDEDWETSQEEIEPDEEEIKWAELYAMLSAGPDSSTKASLIAGADHLCNLMGALTENWPEENGLSVALERAPEKMKGGFPKYASLEQAKKEEIIAFCEWLWKGAKNTAKGHK